jgi:hypothetical protein
METKFKLGDRVCYIGKKRYGKPIPNTEYNIISNGIYRDIVDSILPDECGDYEYDIAPASGNDDQNDHYTCIKEKYLVLVNPSRIIFG